MRGKLQAKWFGFVFLFAFLFLTAGPAVPAENEAAPALGALAYPEGAYFYQSRLFFTEMERDRVLVSDARGGFSVFWSEPGCGPTSISALHDETFLITCHLGGRLVIFDKTAGARSQIAETPAGRRIARPNDSASDGAGGAFFSDSGEFAPSMPHVGRIYHFNGSTITEIKAGLHYANGVAYDAPSETLYFTEHFARKIYKIAHPLDIKQRVETLFWDYAQNPCSKVGAKRWQFGPDGIEIRPQGGLYVAVYGGEAVYEIGGDGKCAAVHPVGATLVTNVALDRENETLWIVAPGVNPENSTEGALFKLSLGAGKKTR